MKGQISVLVLRANDVFSEQLRSAGMRVTNLPLIKTEIVEDQRGLIEKLANIDIYDGIFFTSPVAADAFVTQAENRGSFSGKIYVLGERVRRVLADAGYSVVFDAEFSTAEELVTANLEELRGKHLLFIRGSRSMMSIPYMLKDKADVDEVVVYRTVERDLDDHSVDTIRKQLDSDGFDWLCFFSPSAVDAFTNRFGSDLKVPAAVVGSTTANQAEGRGLTVGFISANPGASEFAVGFIAHVDGK